MEIHPDGIRNFTDFFYDYLRIEHENDDISIEELRKLLVILMPYSVYLY